jgi:lipoprotein-anchoring transpeptidase ErfK/SrfK
MQALAPLLLAFSLPALLLAGALPLRAGPLDDPDHPLRPIEVQLKELPPPVVRQPGRQLVLLRGRRQLLLLEQGQIAARYPVAVGMAGWETPTGSFKVIEKVVEPSWRHPQSGDVVQGGSDENPLGSRWIGFYQDCDGRSGFDGERHLDIKGCTTSGFHGTPHRWTVGHAVSHGCVRLFDEDIKALFDQVRRGTPVTVLP